MDWVEGLGELMPVTRLDDDLCIVSMSPAALRLNGVTHEQALGKTLSELAQRQDMASVLPPGWRRAKPMSKDPVGGLLEDAARLYGNATAWIWLLTPRGRMFRAILNVVKLSVGYIVYLANIEDPFNRSLVRADQEGIITDSLGAHWTLQTMQLFEDFVSGNSLHQIAADHGIPTSRVRTVLDELAAATGFSTAGALRAAVYRSYADELMPARQSIFPVLSDELPGFPLFDRPPL
ncbi:PAS domain-containing protein [Haliea sp. E1-2-M8]|uniref:PAS domain-containing protein n=1 Tax=Haliea sp. E1-2-M8 TaxID=3064706 RepID=UPI00271AE793|nr:PAS domain-containing protein [Haliea sp. E1-2-M8]MDO8862367.1 PAS domain-containing protein [Haliea sp. E1-2-M8]